MLRIVFCLTAMVLSNNLLVAQNAELEKSLQATSADRLLQEVIQQGDARRGAILFYKPELQCASCHATTAEASPLGPHLAQWSSKPTPQELIDSILRPSNTIRKGYETIRVLTEEDQVFSGLLVQVTESEIHLREASRQGEVRVFRKVDLQEISRPAESIMPRGLVAQLEDRGQFFDLAKYVLEIAENGPEYASQLQPPAALTMLPPLPEYESHVAHEEMLRGLDQDSFKRGRSIYNRVCANCHGTHDQEGSLPTSPRFASSKLKNGYDPFSMYQTLTHGHGLMVAQRWMVPQQKYDVIHYIREAYFKDTNSELYQSLDDDYLASLPKGDTRGPEPASFEKYVAMDYGPSLINTYEIELNNDGEHLGRDLGRNPRSNEPWANPDHYFQPGEAPNYAYKGVAVRLDAGPGGVSRGKYWAVYDHDTLSMNAVWGGSDFIDYCCIQFDGQHNTHNRLKGQIFLENPVGPGWAQPLTGIFADPRPLGRDGRPYGPLPKAWYEYRGLYHHGLKTVLAYRVGSAEILELPEVLDGEAPLFVRKLSITAAEHRLRLRLAPIQYRGDQISIAHTRHQALELVQEDGFWVLEIAAHNDPMHLQIVLSAAPLDERFDPSEPVDLAAYTQGGPARWPQRIKTPLRTVHDDVFAVDELSLPSANPWNAQVRATGLDFFADAKRMALCTWDGDVWLVSGAAQDEGELVWQRIATGLFQPLGLKIVNEQIFVTCRDQLVRLHDLNGDGETDFYECFNSDHQVTEHFHEFAMGLQTDDQGNFYYAKSGRHAKRAVVPQHGTLLRVAADGSRTDILATGFRAANGVCLNPDGSFFVTDQEGHWNPKNRINWVTEGGFYGNMYSFTEHLDSSDDAMEQPLCWITNAFDRSPAELLWVPKEAWGPFGGTLLNLSYGYGKIFVVPHESVNGQLQGGMCQLPIPDFPSGLIRGRFHPQRHDLYVCGMFSWAGSRQAPGCLHRVRYAGKPAHLPIQLNAASNTVEITFSHPLARETAEDPSRYEIQAWDLKRTANYGSKHFNERTWSVASAQLSSDGRTVQLQIPELQTTWGMSIGYSLLGANGRHFDGLIHNTIHHLRAP